MVAENVGNGTNETSHRRRFVPVVSFGLLALIWNPPAFDWWIGSAVLEERGLRWLLVVLSSVFLLTAVLALVRGSSKTLVRSALLCFTVFAVFPLAAEGLVRVGMKLDVGDLGNPSNFSDPYTDGDYWKLLYRSGNLTNVTPAVRSHPRLGWAQKSTPQNPLGILAEIPYEPQYDNAILFYGDSFVASTTPMPEKLPQQLDRLMTTSRVYNYGFGGYGVGQILLRFQDTHEAFNRPKILIGILTTDVDRSVLPVRTGPKPYFAVRGDELVTLGLPVPPDPVAYFETSGPEIRSYALSFVLKRMREIAAGGDWSEAPYGRRRKKRVNKRLVDEMVKEAEEHGLELMFVLMRRPTELDRDGWRAEFLRKVFALSGRPWLDTKEPLLARAAADGVDPRSFYGQDAHHNALGNRIIAEALHAALIKEGW